MYPLIRHIQESDLAAILKIQALCYTEILNESERCILAKLTASPGSCFVACQDDHVVGYLLSLPTKFEHPPELDTETV
jgi:hypothetical protein